MFSFIRCPAALAAALLLVPTQAVNGFWILTHSSLTTDRLDPIVNPGAVSMHLHTIIGGSNFGPTLDTATMHAAECTTSQVQADMSSYWAPQLYHQNQNNGSLTLIPISFVNTYYLQRTGPTQSDMNAFPEGLRMLAGNPYRTSYNASDMSSVAVSYVCLDYSINPTGNQNAFPSTQCQDGLRAQIVFPSCWDGVNLDSADHKSHVAYPIGAPDSGDCPSSHPTKLITLFNEWVFDVGAFEFVSGANNWVWSFGDEVGYGFHADFINGWDSAVLSAAVSQCTGQLFNDLEACPPFAASLNRTLAASCSIPSIVEENVQGPLAQLPGCNPIPAQANATCPGLVTPAIQGYTPASTAAGSAPTGAASSTPAIATPTASAASGSASTAGAASSAASSATSAPASASSKMCRTTQSPSRKRAVRRGLSAHHHRRGTNRLASHH